MATALSFLLILSSSIIVISSAAASPLCVPPSPSPPDYSYLQSFPPTSNLSAILSSLGFQQLSIATATASLPNSITTTIFAPTDSSLLACPSCSLPLLLLEHSVPGLYPLHFLRNLAFGTKIQTIACDRCLTITSTRNTTATNTTVFVGGLEITHPDLHNDGQVIIHGIQGFVTHLSPLSCNLERLTSLYLPPFQPNNMPFFIMRFLLQDAMHRLRISGYSLLSLAMREKFDDLLDLQAMTVFALDDASIFGRVGHAYFSELMLHFVPNQRLMAADLIKLPANTTFPTMDWGQNLVVTVAGGGGLLTPMRINNVKVTRANLLYNNKIVVHGVSAPFPRVHQTKMGYWPDPTANVEDQDPESNGMDSEF